MVLGELGQAAEAAALAHGQQHQAQEPGHTKVLQDFVKIRCGLRGHVENTR